MKNITKLAFLALLLISTNTILAQNTQENDSIITVELNEIVGKIVKGVSRGNTIQLMEVYEIEKN